MLASRHTVAYKIDFLNNYNAQTDLTFKSFCIENNVAIKTARGWGPQLQIAIKAEIVVVNILDKRCLIDAYSQQTLARIVWGSGHDINKNNIVRS